MRRLPMPPSSDDALLYEEGPAERNALEVDRIVPLIKKLDNQWLPPVRIDSAKWVPHLSRPDRNWALHVHLSDGCPRYIRRRLVAAAEAGHLVHVALPLEALYDSEVLEVLGEADASVYVVDVGGQPTPRRHFLAAMADLSVPVEPLLRRKLASAVWNRRADGTPNQQGRRLEALIAFLLAQAADLSIYERNFRSATGEIDIVLRVDNFSGRIWFTPGVPFIHVESKNTQDVVGQPVVSILIRKLQISRGRARIGLLFGANGFSSDARDEELRLSESELCIAFFDSEAIEALIEADDVEAYLERHIGDAMIR